MIVAFDTFRYSSFAYTVGGVFESWISEKVKYYVTSKRPIKQGEGEINYILDCLKMLNQDYISNIIVDGYVWTSNDGQTLNKGFGKLLQESLEHMWILNPTVIGVATEKYPRNIPYSVEVQRGIEKKGSLWVTSSEYLLTESDARLVSRMHGDDVVPTIIQDVKRKTKEFLEDEASVLVANAVKASKRAIL